MERTWEQAPGPEEGGGAAPSSDGTPGLPPYFRFSTDDVPPEGKFETWRDLWMRRLVEVEMSTEQPEDFHGQMDLWGAGPIAVARFDVSRAVYERTTSFANNGNNDFSFGLCDGARGHVNTPKGDISTVGFGGAFLLSHDRRYKVVPSDIRYPFCLLRLDRSALLELMPRDIDIDVRTFQPDQVMALIRDSVPLITNMTEPMTPQRRAEVGQQIIDLIALLLNPTRDGRALIESRGLKAARLGAVLQAIDRQFADPRFSAESAGRAVGLSARHVNRLLEKTTKTFYEHLLERRLVHAHRLLADPAASATKIAEVAFQAGFTNTAYFSQCFRRRFGDTPTGLRATTATEHAVTVLRQTLVRGEG
jgi:AraC-like DNA-binding protein